MTEEQIKDCAIEGIDYGTMIITIKKVMKKRHMSIYRLSKRTGIKYHLLKKYYYNDIYRIDLANVAKICHVLNCHSSDVIKYIPSKKSLE